MRYLERTWIGTQGTWRLLRDLRAFRLKSLIGDAARLRRLPPDPVRSTAVLGLVRGSPNQKRAPAPHGSTQARRHEGHEGFEESVVHRKSRCSCTECCCVRPEC